MFKRMHALAECSITLSVPFYDVDGLGIVWHGNYLKYCENARDALYDKCGCTSQVMAATGCIFPVVDLRLSYHKSLRYEDKAEIKAGLIDCETRLKVAFEISLHGELCCSGYTVQAAVDRLTGRLQLEVPEVMQQLFAAAQRSADNL